MSRYGTAIAERLPASGRLFRWHGPSLIAVMPLPETDEAMNAEAARITTAPSEYLIEQDDRSVFLKPNASWTVLAIRRSCEAIDFSAKLDTFVGSHASFLDPTLSQN